ncbi:hypothetical protein [Flavobacterium sp. NRK1]|uniref:hypothetical protein n=1 Tax=Flavobacterium sp. NRK1 TaxID=2954929 RepID=UPI0020937317|nr:hypothetical protein [Flavobacterium sp. NRK1]MCO6147427.1 hypothetical protein [Flavobacterium sp. NRK1]
MKNICLFMLLMFMISCNKEVGKNDKSDVKIKTSEKKEVTEKYVFQKVVFEPEKATFTKVGLTVIDIDTIDVAFEYTNNITYAQPTSDIYDNKGVYNYREMLIHLISQSTKDTITLKKEMFKVSTRPEEYKRMLLQSAMINVQTKKGIIPLIIYLCKTESDICDYYDVRIKDGKAVIAPFNEDDFIED